MSDDTPSLGKIGSALSVSVLGVDFIDDPESFVLAVIYRAVVDEAISTAGAVGVQFGDIWRILADVVIGDLGRAISLPFSAAGDSVLDVIDIVDSIAIELGSSAGPFGIILIPLVWAVVVIALAAVLLGLWRAYQWIRTVIV